MRKRDSAEFKARGVMEVELYRQIGQLKVEVDWLKLSHCAC